MSKWPSVQKKSSQTGRGFRLRAEQDSWCMTIAGYACVLYSNRLHCFTIRELMESTKGVDAQGLMCSSRLDGYDKLKPRDITTLVSALKVLAVIYNCDFIHKLLPFLSWLYSWNFDFILETQTMEKKIPCQDFFFSFFNSLILFCGFAMLSTNGGVIFVFEKTILRSLALTCASNYLWPGAVITQCLPITQVKLIHEKNLPGTRRDSEGVKNGNISQLVNN